MPLKAKKCILCNDFNCLRVPTSNYKQILQHWRFFQIFQAFAVMSATSELQVKKPVVYDVRKQKKYFFDV